MWNCISACVCVHVCYSDLTAGGAEQVWIDPFEVPENNWRYFCFFDDTSCWDRLYFCGNNRFERSVTPLRKKRCSVRPVNSWPAQKAKCVFCSSNVAIAVTSGVCSSGCSLLASSLTHFKLREAVHLDELQHLRLCGQSHSAFLSKSLCWWHKIASPFYWTNDSFGGCLTTLR